jgi:elongation factor P hydroxylase
MGPDGITYACGSQWRRRWYGKRYLHRSHRCIDDKACADACMVLIASTINRNGDVANWKFDGVQLAENQRDFGDWYVTVGRKANSKPSKRR